MGHSAKFSSYHPVDAPEGHRLPHAATAPVTMDSKNHKHFHAHSHNHVATPYPVLEHSSTMSTMDSGSSTGSTDYMQSHKHRHHRPSIPNPVHAVQDHVSEFRYGHTARSAKRDAKKSSSHPWSLDAQGRKGSEPIEEKYEEVIEDWKEKDEQAWAAEMQKRERARRSTASWNVPSSPETTS